MFSFLIVPPPWTGHHEEKLVKDKVPLCLWAPELLPAQSPAQREDVARGVGVDDLCPASAHTPARTILPAAILLEQPDREPSRAGLGPTASVSHLPQVWWCGGRKYPRPEDRRAG